MELSIFLAKIFAIYFTVAGIAVFLRHKEFYSLIDQMKDSHLFILFGGSLNIILGSMIVVSHNHWENNWKVIITLLGWIMLVKGIKLMLMPKKVLEMAKKILTPNFLKADGFILLLLGLYLGYIGFVL